MTIVHGSEDYAADLLTRAGNPRRIRRLIRVGLMPACYFLSSLQGIPGPVHKVTCRQLMIPDAAHCGLGGKSRLRESGGCGCESSALVMEE